VADKAALDALDVTKNSTGDTRFASDSGQMYIWDGTIWEATGKPSTLIPSGTNDGDVLSWDLATTSWAAKAPVAGRSQLVNMLDTNFSYTDSRHGAGLPVVGNALVWAERPLNSDPASPKGGVWIPGTPHPKLKEWSPYQTYDIDDLVYHKGRLWRATNLAIANKNIEPNIVDGDSVALWTNSAGVGSGPRLVERVNIVADPNTAPAAPALPPGTTAQSQHVWLQYADDTNWAVWNWVNTRAAGSATPGLVWQWVKIDGTGGQSVWRNVALPSPNPTRNSVTLWIYGLEGNNARPIASKIGWQPVALGDFLISMADVQASGASSGDLLISNGLGRWIASPNPGYTKAETDKKIGDLVIGLEHGEAVQSITNTPPATPVVDEFYIVGLAPTGAWVGHSNAVAWWNGTAWQFEMPTASESHLVEDQDGIFHWNGTTWVKVASAAAGSTAASGVGEIIPWLADAVPADYLPCDGRTVAVSAYADLYAVIGNKYNTGTTADGVSTFSLPDLRDYFVRGVNAGGNPAVGTKHDWTTGKPRSNFTTDNSGAHTHAIKLYGTGSRGDAVGGVHADSSTYDANPTESAGAHSHVVNGGGDSETAPKHFTVQWVIRTKAINGGARGPSGVAGVGMPSGTAADQVPVYDGTNWVAKSVTSMVAPTTYTKTEADAKYELLSRSDGINQKYVYHTHAAEDYGINLAGVSPGNFIEMDGTFQPDSNAIPLLILQFDNNTFVYDSSTVDSYQFLEKWSNDGDKRVGYGHVSQANLKGILSCEAATRFAKSGMPAKLKISCFKIDNYWQILWSYFRISDNDTPMTDDGSMQIHTTNAGNLMTFMGLKCVQGASPATASGWVGNFVYRWK
jgi:microcystin-dependent protein